jgi:hypothetical protein
VDDETWVERRFDLAGATLLLRVQMPRPDPGGGFRCDFVIDWPGGPQPGYAGGEDAVQAMILALQGAHVRLLTSPEYERGELTWLGDRNLGLPIADVVRDLIPPLA